MVKIRRRHEWHIRCLQASLADFEIGTSDKQVKHSTLSHYLIQLSKDEGV